MARISEIHIASKYGAVDSAAVVDGEAGNAHLLREVVRNSNRLAVRGGPLFVQGWDASTDGSEANVKGARGGYAPYGEWTPILPGALLVPKPPYVNKVTLRALIHVSGTAAGGGNQLSSFLRLDTSMTEGSLNRFDTERANVVEVQSDGATLGTGTNNGWQMVTLEDVPVRRGTDFEPIWLWLMGDPNTGALMSTATFGGRNTGTVNGITPAALFETQIMYDSGAAWNGPASGGSVLGVDDGFGGHVVEFVDSASSLPVYTSGKILSVERLNSTGTTADAISFAAPDMPQTLVQQIIQTGATYNIYSALQYRLASVAVYAQDAEVIG